ncbi:MAG: endonuclease domain-containing protein [Gemmatimonadota bacterium]
MIERVFPSVYVCSGHLGDPDVMLRAAARYVGDRGAFSHHTGLLLHGLAVADPDDRLHVTVARAVRLRSNVLLSVHRRATVGHVTTRRGLRVLDLDHCLVGWWRDVTGEQRRAPVIDALRGRRTTGERLLLAAASLPLRSRRELEHLVGLVSGGSHSELEIWGYLDVFDVPELHGLVRQFPFRVGATTYWLDLADERSKTAIELDGATAHGLPGQRERDLRRDARLAALGWLTLRFSPQRLRLDRDAVRRETIEAIAARTVDRPA